MPATPALCAVPAVRLLRRVAAYLLVAGAVLAGGSGCAGSEPAPEFPADLVPGEPADYESIEVDGVPLDESTAVLEQVVPILTARTFDDPAPLADYGLDTPRHRITFVAVTGDPLVFDLGGQNFDRTGYYVRRLDDLRVRLVLDDSLDPILDSARP